MAKKPFYKSNEEVRKDDIVQTIDDLVSMKYYKYKKIDRENLIKYMSAQCKEVRKTLNKKNILSSVVMLSEIPSCGLIQVLVSWHTAEPFETYYFCHVESYIGCKERPSNIKLGEF